MRTRLRTRRGVDLLGVRRDEFLAGGQSKVSTVFGRPKEPPVPKPDSSTTGAPCWIDLMTSDPDTIRAFYGRLFGWTSVEGGEEYGGYINFLRDGEPVAGCMRNDPQFETPDVWAVYLASADAQATADAAAANGGEVMVPVMDVLDLGRMAVVGDAGGASIGVWQAGAHQGFHVVGEIGAPNWFELHTRDFDASLTFYRDVFGWDVHIAGDTPDFRYATLGEGDNQRAGIMDASAFLPEGVPAHWSIYFGVDDVDATLATVTELGGAVVLAAEDTPYGRLATASDPTGAVFKLMSGG
jgi:predicted enzyme related to lactoylglutathione lyase